MKITFNPQINQSGRINKQQIQTSDTNTSNAQTLPKNSKNELLGRYQLISFKGTTHEGNVIVEHTYTNRSKEEQIRFNKQNGGYTHTIHDKRRNRIIREDVSPSEGTEVSTIIDENGTATITTKKDNSVTVEKLDSENRRIYLRYTNSEGLDYIETTDYKRGRKIIRQSNYKIQQPLKVIDLETGEPVTSGPLVIDRRYDKQSDTYITENIVTKERLKEEKYDSFGNLISAKEYNPSTGSLLKETTVDKAHSATIENNYTGEKDNKLKSTIYTSKQEREIFLYADDGETIKEHVLYTYKKNGLIESKTKYNPSGAISEKAFYNKGNISLKYLFDETTNRPKSALKYNNKGLITSETLFYEDGKTPKARKVISKDGSITITEFDKESHRTQIKFYNSNRQLELIDIYNPKTNVLTNSIEFNLKTGERKIITYDDEYEITYKEMVMSKEGKILSKTIYFADGKTPQYQRIYNADGSYSDTEFDEYGRVIKIIEHTAGESE